MKKETYRFFWEKEEELLDGVCSHPFRHKDDVSQYVLREYQKLSGDFVPRNTHKFCKYFNLKPENPELVKTITKQTAKCICINDSNFEIPYEHVKRELNDAFSKLFRRNHSLKSKFCSIFRGGNLSASILALRYRNVLVF